MASFMGIHSPEGFGREHNPAEWRLTLAAVGAIPGHSMLQAGQTQPQFKNRQRGRRMADQNALWSSTQATVLPMFESFVSYLPPLAGAIAVLLLISHL
jgi:hypothetical protein